MKKFDYIRDQHLIEMRIGIERPLLEFTENFTEQGIARLHQRPISVGDDYQRLPHSNTFGPSDTVPFIYSRVGYIRFETTRWGLIDETLGVDQYFRQLEAGSFAYCGLVPASFVDLCFGPDIAETCEPAFRIRARHGDNLYVGAVYEPGQANIAESLRPFIVDAGADVAPYMNWQPLLFSMSKPPKLENFEFVESRNTSRMPDPLPVGSLEIQRISVRRSG